MHHTAMGLLDGRAGFRPGLAFVMAFGIATASGLASVGAAAQPAQTPFHPPAVSDPMLAPPPAAPREVRSWDDALALLREHSPDYITSEESVRRAEAQARIALAAVLPTLNGQGTYVHQFFTETIPFGGVNIVTPPPDVFSASAALQWNVLSPRALYAVGTARDNVRAVALSFEDRRRAIALAVVNAMLSTLAASRVAELNRVGLRSALERLALTQARLEYGQGTPLDVDRAAQDVAAARGQLITGDESLRQSREALGAALGSTTATSAPGDLRLDEFDAAVARTCRLNDDIERRPDVAAARLRAEIAQRGVHDAELLFSPSLSVGSQATASTVAVLAPLDTWSVQAVLTVPLYDGGVRYGALKDSRAALEQARQALITARVNAVVSATQAQRSVSVYEASRQVAQEQRDLAARIDQRTREGYARGAGTSLDLVVSAQSLRQADINLVLL
ncbi:MAG TPA: TolC family protein, partial [Polyangiaceae bacterium]|nr:TolC family protein [Polyangiaceae bacterium]